MSLAPRLVAVPSISNIRCRENSKQNHKASCSKSAKSKNATENANAKNNGTENAKNMRLPTLNFLRCIFLLQLATLHFLRCIFFAILINVCIFFTKKKCKTNATAPKQMQRKMRKNATSNVAFSELHFFCNLRRRIFLADFFPFQNLRHCIF